MPSFYYILLRFRTKKGVFVKGVIIIITEHFTHKFEEMALRGKCEVCLEADAEVYNATEQLTSCCSCSSTRNGGAHCISLKATTGKAIPKCDICQQENAVFFCREDRALLCPKCDSTIHNANDTVRAHHRFLFSALQVDQERVGNSAAASGSYAKSRFAGSSSMSGANKRSNDDFNNSRGANARGKYGKDSVAPYGRDRAMETQLLKRPRMSRNGSENDLFGHTNATNNSNGNNNMNSENGTNDMSLTDGTPIGQLLQIPNLADDYGLKDVDDFGDFSNEEWQDLQYALFEAPQSVPGSSDSEYDLYGSGFGGAGARHGNHSNSNIAYNDDIAVPDFGSG